MTKEDLLAWLKIFGALITIAVVLKLSEFAYLTNQDLKEAQCKASYWKARAQGQAASYCPPTCDCVLMR